MVPLIKDIEKQLILETRPEVFMYNSFYGLSFESFKVNKLNTITAIAYEGYKKNKVEQEKIVSIINKPTIKGIDYSNNIYNFIGIHLASELYYAEEIQKRFDSFSAKNKFAVSLFFADFREQLKELVKNSKNPYERLLYLLFISDRLSNEDENLIYSMLTNNANADMLDVILYNELQRKFTRFKFNDKSSVELIKDVFGNFQDAIKHLTEIRRKDRKKFEINDEYDVQDITYLILRSVFFNLQFENPHFKTGGTHSRVDLMLEKEGIDIELKMIKKTDNDEKRFIEQIKIDINDYATWGGLKDLIVFVYDPFNKTTNKNNFYELSGIKKINNIEFVVHVIVSN